MGQAKQRGTLEERIVQSRERQRLEGIARREREAARQAEWDKAHPEAVERRLRSAAVRRSEPRMGLTAMAAMAAMIGSIPTGRGSRYLR